MRGNYSTTVKITNQEKVGEGFGAFIRYKICVETDHPDYKGTSFEVNRRFKEFHALYETLVDTYRQKGIHIPHPPEKSISTSTAVKINVGSITDSTKLEKRMVQLERWMNRLAAHPILVQDENVINFLTQLIAGVKARDNLIKLKENFSTTLRSVLPETDEYDTWFEENFERINGFEVALERLYAISLDLHVLRKELSQECHLFIPALEQLRSTENNKSVVKAFEAIINLKEKSVPIIEKQSSSDLRELVCTTKDTLDDIISVRHLFTAYQRRVAELHNMEGALLKLKDSQTKAESAQNLYQSEELKKRISESQKTLEYTQDSLHKFYSTLQSEFNDFQQHYIQSMRTSFLRYVKLYKEMQSNLLQLYEEALPVVSSIDENLL